MGTGRSPIRRTALAAGSALASVGIWTGAPLLAVWVGSRYQQWAGDRSPGAGESMGAIIVIVVTLAALEIALTIALSRMSDAYDRVVGRPHSARRTSPWLRSMRGEREESARNMQGISAIERVVVISVVACALAFEVWFFFFAGSSLPNST